MKERTQDLQFADFDSLVRSDRLERGVAVTDAIASLIAATVFGLTRAIDSIKR